ncbi:hypothetical protein CHS0354_023302 [Potamilus streckersoni]|uniref:Uncharacterized protein n=1 Tax=Potamilus streckersoni TaxID=2493646 RepID=A0AAE0T4N9_9BIVA|nr:hypothetical protein CHS0354_023302 [Potamilus streckersoni]
MANAPVPERSFDNIAPKDKGKGKVSIEVALKSFKPEHNATAFFTTDKVFKIEATVDAKVYSKLVPALKEEDIEMPPKIEKYGPCC